MTSVTGPESGSGSELLSASIERSNSGRMGATDQVRRQVSIACLLGCTGAAGWMSLLASDAGAVQGSICCVC